MCSQPTTINGRIRVTAKCAGGCGKTLDQFVKPGTLPICSDCWEKADREKNGWTPANSCD